MITVGLAGALGASLLWMQQAPAVQADPAPPPETFEADRDEVRDAARALVALAALAERPLPPTDPAQPSFGLEVAQSARHFLQERPVGFRADCSGFVSAVFSEVGVDMDHTVETVWSQAVDHGAVHYDQTPRVGDLVFFDDTHDRNGDGWWNDSLTHVGVVLDVEPDGTILFAHDGTSAGRSVGRMNLREPWVHEVEGERLNSYLRIPAPWDPPTARYLAGELFTAFATVDPDEDWM